MAATFPVSCIKCKKLHGLLQCKDCFDYFCFEHVNQHKLDVEKQLDDLIFEEKCFQENLSLENDLFIQIDLWKKENINKIKDIAKQTKLELKEILENMNDQLKIKSNQIKENLFVLKNSQDFSENHLKNLINQLENLKKDIHSFELIKSTNEFYLKIQKQNKENNSNKDILRNDNYIDEKREGSIVIREIDRYGHFLTIEHNGSTTNQDQDMIGWTIKRSIDSYQTYIYHFPNDFILKSKTSIKILSKQASQTIYSYEKDRCLIADSIPSWGYGLKSITNQLLDATGNQIHILTEKFY